MYFNTHTHLNSPELYPERDKYVQNARVHGVDSMVVVGYDLESSRLAIKVAEEFTHVYAAVGISPTECLETRDEDLDEIEALSSHPKVVAIGEIGLDYYWKDVPKDKQQVVFKKQIQIAKKRHLPIIIHARDAYEDSFEILKEAHHYGIMHCYSGSYQMAKRYIEIGYYISLAGPVTFKNAKVPKEVATKIGIDHLLIETDCPYLAPQPLRGTQNEPANVVYIAQEIAKLKNMEIEDVASITAFNAKNVFGIK